MAALTCAPTGSNTVLGNGAQPANVVGGGDTAVGQNALHANTQATQDTAIGQDALQHADDPSGVHAGSGNSALGLAALQSNTSGTNNSALGFLALQSNTSGTNNTAVGVNALNSNTTQSDSTAVGFGALGVSTGALNTAVGLNAGNSLTTGSSNVDIANSGTAGESNTIRIGTSCTGTPPTTCASGQQDATFVAGVSGINVGASPAVLVSGSGQLGVNTSSQRFKTDIRPLASALGGLMALRPVSFRYKPQDVRGPNPTEYGLIAEQVARVYPNLVADGRDGKPYTVLYQELPALLLAQAQRAQVRIERQQREIDRLAKEVRALERHARR
jgi:hypothetical protein